MSDFFFFCHEVPRVAIFDDVTDNVIMTSFADLPGKFENSYTVSHSFNHNSDFTNKTKIQLYHENWWVNNVTIKMLFIWKKIDVKKKEKQRGGHHSLSVLSTRTCAWNQLHQFGQIYYQMPRSISSQLRPVRLKCTDHRIIEILGLRPSNRLPVSYYGTKSQLW